ncbi:MAG: 3-hydroxyacyl-CoA dehydrogenase [Rhodospirillales bacterium]
MVGKPLNENFRIGVIGAGTMGRGITQVAALGGLSVVLTDAQEGAARDARGFVEKMLARAVERKRLEQKDADDALGRITIADSLQGLADCDLVIEAIIENLDIKKKIFKQLEDICRDDTILASNTSALPIAAIGAECAHRNRIAGMHFFNPVPLMRLAEVIYTPFTDGAVIGLLSDVAERMGRTPVRVKDSPGFLANNAGRAWYTEGLRLAQEQIAPPEDIDRIVRDAGGFRMGPFELIDLVGLDVNYPANKSIFEDFFNDPRYRPSLDQRLLFEARTLGRKSGRGFYRYGEDNAPLIDPEPDMPKTLPKKVWIWGHDKTARAKLAALAKAAGVAVDTAKKPSKGTPALLAPRTEDATASALAVSADPARSMAVDTLFGWETRRTAMTPPGADESAARTLLALLAADGTKVTRINDSPGFIMPRLQAVMTNLAGDICQQGIAAPGDLDIAMKLGFNYPEGPLEAGDRLGARLILDMIEALYGYYGDDRYRPSPWLKRRALLGLSLKTPERTSGSSS